MVKIDVRNLGIPLLLFLFVFFCYQIREITRYFLNRPNGLVSLPSPFLLQGCDQDFRSGMEWGRGGKGLSVSNGEYSPDCHVDLL